MFTRSQLDEAEFYKPMRLSFLTLIFLAFVVPPQLFASVITFEGYADRTVITTQYAGLTFSSTTLILTEGVSLSDQYPPYSGVNVAHDRGGWIAIRFATPVVSFAGYFTYRVPLTVNAYDSNNALVASAVSLFSDNTLSLFADPGSSPNEYIHLSVPGGISIVTLTGLSRGGSFTVDDVTYSSIPEPQSLIYVLLSLSAVALRLRQTVALRSRGD